MNLPRQEGAAGEWVRLGNRRWCTEGGCTRKETSECRYRREEGGGRRRRERCGRCPGAGRLGGEAGR